MQKIVLVGLISALVACSSKFDPSGPQPKGGDFEIRPGVVIIPDETAQHGLTVNGARVSLPLSQYAELKPGAVLVSGWENGLLRGVESVSIQGDRVVASTTPVPLGAAISRGRLSTRVRLADCQGNASVRRCGLSSNALFSGLTVGGVPLFESSDVSVSIAQGNVGFDPVVDISMDIADGRIVSMDALVDGNFSAELEVDAHTARAATQSYRRSLWMSEPFISVQRIGNVPVVQVITITLEGGFELETHGAFDGRTGVETHGRIIVGGHYRDGRWTPAEQPETLTVEGSTMNGTGTFKLRALVQPRVDVKLYGVAGPYMSVEAYAEASTSEAETPPTERLVGGVRGRFGTLGSDDLDILGAGANGALRYEGIVLTAERMLAPSPSSTSDEGDGGVLGGEDAGSVCAPFLRAPIEQATLDNGRSDGCDPVSWAFDWTDCDGASAYHLFVAREGATTPFIDRTGLTDSRFTMANAGSIASDRLSGWFWRVRAQIDGQWGPWSETRRFTVEEANTDPPAPGCGAPADAGVADAGEPPPPSCSRSSAISSGINWYNRCAVRVATYWVGFGCEEHQYSVLSPGGGAFQQTYVTHPWRVRNADTGALIMEVPAPTTATPINVTICP